MHPPALAPGSGHWIRTSGSTPRLHISGPNIPEYRLHADGITTGFPVIERWHRLVPDDDAALDEEVLDEDVAELEDPDAETVVPVVPDALVPQATEPPIPDEEDVEEEEVHDDVAPGDPPPPPSTHGY